MASVSPNLPTTESPSQRFFQYFQLEATALQQQMARLKDVPTIGGERMDAIDHCLGGISRLQKEVQDAFSYTTAYDQKMYTEGIKALHEKLQETKTALAPKSKFSFKSAKKNNSAISLSDAAELAMQQHAHLLKPSYLSSGKSSLPPTPADAVTPPKDSQSKSIEPPDKDSLGRFLNAAGVQSVAQEDRPHSAVRKMSFTSSNEVNISAYTAVHIILPNSAAHATSSGSLTYLDRCIVDMSIPTASTQPFAALTVKDVKSSLLICGNVSGSTHVTNVDSSVLLVTTRQFRMHQCRNCIVYLYINSDPIIEDCAGIRFAPLPKAFVHDPSFITTKNHFDQVQDFRWLRSDPSPNWSILSSSEMVSDEIWTGIARTKPGLSLEDLLRASGVTELATQLDH